MRIELTELLWVEDDGDLSVAELAERSGLSEEEILELVDCGVFEPIDPAAAHPTFRPNWTVAARTAFRLRTSFDLDARGIALAMKLLDRVQDLERQLSELRAHLPSRLR
jgi:chaperone modulatory protein CbpM